ncbi:hypothetical protein DL768_007902 [Monosporascus sp. mg162]|nr:hypothetical protein DL768_007902 [Monosporascus sp. mg162]
MREINLEASLLGRERRPRTAETTGYCPNLLQRPTLMWIKPIEMGFQTDKVTDPEWPFLNRLASICAEAEAYTCNNRECEKNRETLEGIVQNCEWKGFREWIIRVVSCQMSFAEVERYGQTFFHLASAVAACHWLVYEYKTKAVRFGGDFVGKGGKPGSIGDVFVVLDMIYWAIVVESHTMHMSTVLQTPWSSDFLPIKVLTAAVDKAASSAGELGICLNRLWNLALAGFCRLTSVDSTRVEQLHKCEGRTVPENAKQCSSAKLFFDPEKLNESIVRKGGTVWSIHEPFEILPSREPYVAISHVWSDGTGIGLEKVGEVNPCLFKYFATLIGTIDGGCDGIWWDTISIPTEKKARRKAIDEMHNNYHEAQYTLVHDEYLVNFEWAEDGSPCIALVLSAWLTRGWTALEFIMSRNVKVIQTGRRGPRARRQRHGRGHPGPRPKHLLTGVLDRVPSPTAAAQADYQRFRAPVGPKAEDYKNAEGDITQAILDKLYKIEFPSLLHGLDTTAETGGWSWCPPFLYDMPAVAVSDLFGAASELHSGYRTCVIGKDGVIAGCYRFAPLMKEDVQRNRIHPTSSHPKIVMKVKAALQNWRSCMLMREDPEDRGPCLLVTALGEVQDDKLTARPIEIKYVGCVLELAEGASGEPNRTYHLSSFKMGMAGDRPEVDAGDMFERPSWMPERLKSMDWLPNKVWIGNHPHSGHFLVARRHEASAGHTALHTLKMSDDPVTRTFSFGLEEEPLLVVSWEGEVNTKFNTASITLERVNTKHAWPPTSIPCAERVMIHSKETGDKRNRELSTDLFQLAHETRTYTYAALEVEVLLPSKERPYQGLWACSRPSLILYQPHQRCEVILLNYTGGPQISGVNITGYNENPRGDISFKFSFPRRDRDTGPAAPETEAQVQAEIRAYDSFGRF